MNTRSKAQGKQLVHLEKRGRQEIAVPIQPAEMMDFGLNLSRVSEPEDTPQNIPPAPRKTKQAPRISDSNRQLNGGDLDRESQDIIDSVIASATANNPWNQQQSQPIPQDGAVGGAIPKQIAYQHTTTLNMNAPNANTMMLRSTTPTSGPSITSTITSTTTTTTTTMSNNRPIPSLMDLPLDALPNDIGENNGDSLQYSPTLGGVLQRGAPDFPNRLGTEYPPNVPQNRSRQMVSRPQTSINNENRTQPGDLNRTRYEEQIFQDELESEEETSSSSITESPRRVVMTKDELHALMQEAFQSGVKAKPVRIQQDHISPPNQPATSRIPTNTLQPTSERSQTRNIDTNWRTSNQSSTENSQHRQPPATNSSSFHSQQQNQVQQPSRSDFGANRAQHTLRQQGNNHGELDPRRSFQQNHQHQPTHAPRGNTCQQRIGRSGNPIHLPQQAGGFSRTPYPRLQQGTANWQDTQGFGYRTESSQYSNGITTMQGHYAQDNLGNPIYGNRFHGHAGVPSYDGNPPPAPYRQAPYQGSNLSHAKDVRTLLQSIKPPTFTGSNDHKSAYDFLEKLRQFRDIMRVSDDTILTSVIPYVLEYEAYVWYDAEMACDPFNSWGDFALRFRRQFQSFDYYESLKRDLEKRTQGVEETLHEYIIVILGYYRRMEREVTVSKVIRKIRYGINPKYLPFYRDIAFSKDLRDLKERAKEIDDIIARSLSYEPPPTRCSQERSLDYFPRAERNKHVRESRRDQYERRSGGSNNTPSFGYRSNYQNSQYRRDGSNWGDQSSNRDRSFNNRDRSHDNGSRSSEYQNRFQENRNRSFERRDRSYEERYGSNSYRDRSYDNNSRPYNNQGRSQANRNQPSENSDHSSENRHNSSHNRSPSSERYSNNGGYQSNRQSSTGSYERPQPRSDSPHPRAVQFEPGPKSPINQGTARSILKDKQPPAENNPRSRQGSPSPNRSQERPKVPPKVTCWNCAGPHFAKECPERTPNKGN